MKYLRAFLILALLVCSTKVIAGSTQSNVSGSNTAIEGGYESRRLINQEVNQLQQHPIQQLLI